MKTILIIHTDNSSRKKHFAVARGYNARLILMKKDPTWEIPFVDRVVDVDTRSLSKTVEAALALRETENIDGVITFVEHSVPSAAAAAAALGLPYLSEHTAMLARNKYEMRRAFQAYDIPCPKFELARTLAEALKIGQDFGYPLVLKPLIGGGSMFIRRVDSAADLTEYFDVFRKGAWEGFDYDPLYEASFKDYQGAMLLESYVDGGEVSIESIVSAGKTYTLAIHDKPMPMTGPFFEELYFSTPSRLAIPRVDELHDLTDRANQALGIHIGATHTEFRITAGDPIILETGARIGGGPVYRSVLSATGVDMVRAIMDLSLGIEPDLTIKHRTPTGFYMIFAPQEGIVQHFRGEREVAGDEHTVELEMYRKIGDQVLLPPRVFQCHGHLIIQAPTMEQLDQKMDELMGKFCIEVANG
jgi:biotin carboxylase